MHAMLHPDPISTHRERVAAAEAQLPALRAATQRQRSHPPQRRHVRARVGQLLIHAGERIAAT